jgi:hypothetical protein
MNGATTKTLVLMLDLLRPWLLSATKGISQEFVFSRVGAKRTKRPKPSQIRCPNKRPSPALCARMCRLCLLEPSEDGVVDIWPWPTEIFDLHLVRKLASLTGLFPDFLNACFFD